MRSIKLMCSWCNKPFSIRQAEYNRQKKKGRTIFFCGLSCAAKKRNAVRPDKRILIKKICPHCGEKFETLTGCKSATFCSRSCASAASVTNKRHEAQRKAGRKYSKNLISTEETLRLREMWKYKDIQSFLNFIKEPFEFEYRMGNYIFDLCLPKKTIFIEFDGNYHEGKKQSDSDRKKDEYATQNGWTIIRKKVPNNTVIKPDILYNILPQ